jgi:ribonuclease P protein component
MNVPGTPLPLGRPSAPFPRSARILLSRDFQNVFDHETNVVGKLMVMWLGKSEGPGFRLGVIASKRTFRRAVDRNRAKRLLREAFRLNRATLKGSGDLVIVARRRILGMKRQAVEREFMKLAHRLGIADAPCAGSDSESTTRRS